MLDCRCLRAPRKAQPARAGGWQRPERNRWDWADRRMMQQCADVGLAAAALANGACRVACMGVRHGASRTGLRRSCNPVQSVVITLHIGSAKVGRQAVACVGQAHVGLFLPLPAAPQAMRHARKSIRS